MKYISFFRKLFVLLVIGLLGMNFYNQEKVKILDKNITKETNVQSNDRK